MPWISRAKYDSIQRAVAELNRNLEQTQREFDHFKMKPFLTSIEREGRLNKFTFMRNGERHMIETMGLLSDDLPDWKGKLLR